MIWGKITLALLSIAISTFMIELGLRIFRHPMDYLAPDLVDDPILGFRIVPESGGHDAWGFRNAGVPEKVDVVAIGDSQTWGHAARWEETWPSWYSRMTAQKVYNFGISGYGPAEYLRLLETKALSLDPELIVVGLYYGNDLFDSYQSVSERSHWKSLRTTSMMKNDEIETVEPSPTVAREPRQENPLKRVRRWLRGSSMLFRIIEEGPIGQRINAWGDQQEGFSRDGCIVTTTEPFSTVLQPESRFRALDLDTAAVSDGIDLTLWFVERMADLAEMNDVDFLVVLIPTKESVLMGSMTRPRNACESVLRKIIESEELAGKRIRGFLEQHGIAFVDSLEALRAGALTQRVYLRSADGHPNGQGYRIIAEQVVAEAGRAE